MTMTMISRQAILWRPTDAGRWSLVGASIALIALFAYLHVITGTAYEFYVFFAPPVLLVAWFVGRRAGYGVTIVAVAAWFVGDRLLKGQAELLPVVFNSVSRLVIYCTTVWLLARMRVVLDRERCMAAQDALTHLANRREFYERGRQALGQAQRDASPITAVFIDLDKFKEVNDELGHATGDALLVSVAEVLSARLRSSDSAARLGGDEFALLLPGMGATTARAYVDDLQQRLLGRMSEHRWPVTFSIGVASCERALVDLKVLLAEADKLMYEAKASGRNRVLQSQL